MNFLTLLELMVFVAAACYGFMQLKRGKGGPEDNAQHRANGMGCLSVLFVFFLGMMAGSLPSILNSVVLPIWDLAGVEYPGLPKVEADRETTESEDPVEDRKTKRKPADSEAERLLGKYRNKIEWVDDEIDFPDVGTGWIWFVIDKGNAARGQRAYDLTYYTNDKTSTEVEVYLGKKEDDEWRVSDTAEITRSKP